MSLTDVAIANMALRMCGADIITSLSGSDKESLVCNEFYEYCRDELLEMFPWNFAKAVRPLILTEGYEEYYDYFGGTAPTISNVTQADPCVVTAGTHGLSTGDHCKFTDITGMTEINDTAYYPDVTDANTLTLTGIDSQNFTAYSSGGYVYKVSPLAKYADGYAYDIPSDYIKAVSLENPEDDFEILNDTIFTLTADAVLIYIKSVTTVTEFSKLFVRLLARFLATKICIPLIGAKNGSATLKLLEAKYVMAKNDAELAHATEIKEDDEAEDSWISARS